MTCSLLCMLMTSVVFSPGALPASRDRAAAVAPATQPVSQPPTRPARNENPPGAIDQLVQVENADKWSEGTLVNTNVHPDWPARIELGYKQSEFPRAGSWVGPEVQTRFAFTELIASFNANAPADGGVTLDIRVKQDGQWSPWIYLQCWGKVLTPPGRPLKWDGGHADIDTLVLDKPAIAYQARLALVSFAFDAKASVPSVRRLSVCCSGAVTDEHRRAKIFASSNDPATRPSTIGNWACDLKVPFRGQGDEQNPRAIRGMICSPTSTSMVLEYYGIDRPTAENAMAIYDPYYDLFGNWGRAIAYAGALGLDAHLARFRNWDQVHAEIAQGVPVIASIRFREGQAKGFLYDYTDGHLLVIRGFKSNDDVIVNDPAKKDKGNGVIYKAQELAKAWFDAGGVGYVIQKPKTAAEFPKPR
jgi:hypothetical protein